MSDKESQNYYRLITLVVNTGTRTLREVFKKHTDDDIASVLKKHMKTINTMKNGSKKILTNPQYQLLIADTPDLEKFDISLLVILIRNICTSVETPPGKGWNTVTVPSTDTTVGGYIIRIRNFRNEVVGHSSDTRVSNDLFENYWAEVEECLKELAAHVDVEFLDEIADEIKKTKGMPLTEDSNIILEATLKKWRVEELYTELVQLNQKADEQANCLKMTMDDVSAIRTMMEDGQQTGNRDSANQKTAPGGNDIILFVNNIMNQTKDKLELTYDDVCKMTGMNTTKQQKTKALPPIVNPNALTEEEIVEYSKHIDMNWGIFAVYLGYKTHQTNQLTANYPKQMGTLVWTMLHEWHDVVARCENENPRKLLAAAFACRDDIRTAGDILGDWNLVKEAEKTKPSPETKKKIEDIDFDVASSTHTNHVSFNLGIFGQIPKQQPGTERSKANTIDDVEQKLDEG